MSRLYRIVLCLLLSCLFACAAEPETARPEAARPPVSDPKSSAPPSDPGPAGLPSAPADPPLPSDSKPDPCGKLRAFIDTMTPEEKVGQLIIAGFDGIKAAVQTEKLITDLKVGGLIFFDRNIADTRQLKDLIIALNEQNAGNPGLFLSVDEEGGRVSRLPPDTEALPSAAKLAAGSSPQAVYRAGQNLGQTLRDFGFNMNFAPVLDIFSNPKNTVIGDRAFGTDAETVIRYGLSMLSGLKAGGVIAVPKHFPGHGDTAEDSHSSLPVVTHGTDRLQTVEWAPFRAAIDAGADAVMVSHIRLDAIDHENPATLSSAVITGVLRERLGFSGVVVSDDLTMGAITKGMAIEEAAVQFILSGGDLAVVCHGFANAEACVRALLAAVRAGTLPESQLDESVLRILALKEKYGLLDLSRLSEI